MKLTFALIAVFLVLSVLLPALEAASARRRGRVQRQRASRRVSAFRQRPRRGRQDEDVVEVDENAVDGEELADDEAAEELYNGCDWKTNIGGFLNFCKWRKWCADNQGITDFGPYGGVPASCPPEEEGEAGDDPEAAGSDAEGEEVEAPPAEAEMEARRARARRGRKVTPKKKSFRRANKKTASRRSGRKSFRG